MGNLVKKFGETDPEEIVEDMQQKENFVFDVDGNKIVLDKEDFVFDFDSQEGFAASKRGNFVVFISTY